MFQFLEVPLLVTHDSPSIKVIKIFYYNLVYSNKIIEMWEQVCKIQEPLTPKSLLVNMRLIFGLLRGSTQEPSS